jgi:hypothetical protein
MTTHLLTMFLNGRIDMLAVKRLVDDTQRSRTSFWTEARRHFQNVVSMNPYIGNLCRFKRVVTFKFRVVRHYSQT